MTKLKRRHVQSVGVGNDVVVVVEPPSQGDVQQHSAAAENSGHEEDLPAAAARPRGSDQGRLQELAPDALQPCQGEAEGSAETCVSCAQYI